MEGLLLFLSSDSPWIHKAQRLLWGQCLGYALLGIFAALACLREYQYEARKKNRSPQKSRSKR